MIVYKLRIDEGPVRVMSCVIDAAGALVEPSRSEPGVDIWEEIPQGAIGLSVLSCDEGSGVRYFFGLPVPGKTPDVQEKAIEHKLGEYNLAIFMTAQQQEMNNRIYESYLF